MGLFIPKSDINIERALMPQINSKDVQDFLKWLKNEHGVSSTAKKVPITKVKPSQGEFNPEKIAAMMQKNLSNDKPAIMSNDFYILDGHHRFAADLNKNRNSKFSVYWVDMPFMDLIQAARLYNKSYTKQIHETINTSIDEELTAVTKIAGSILNEGINDPGIFKAIFIAGGPGAGKDYVVKKLLASAPLIEINSDIAFTHALKKAGLSLLMPDNENNQRFMIRGPAKKTTETKKELALAGRLGIIINGTGSNHYEYLEMKHKLEELGYETAMIFVNTSNEESRRRNIERGKAGDRTVPEKIRQQKWEEAQQNLGFYQANFDRMIIVDNTTNLNDVDVNTRKHIQDNWNRIYKFFRAFVGTPVKNPNATAWLEAEKAKRNIKTWEPPSASKFGSARALTRFESINYGSKDYLALKEDIKNFSKEELEELANCENPVVAKLAAHRLI